mgnify:CR=1 FL=1
MGLESNIKPGSPLYVPQSEVGMAHSLGAVLVEGDARLFVPNILPDGVVLDAFKRWVGDAARMIWIGELLEAVVGGPVDLMDVAGLITTDFEDKDQSRFVPLYVPSFEMDRACRIPGVHWDRRRRIYVADETADFLLVHRYLTPAMKSAWIADRNLDVAMSSLVKAKAMIGDKDEDEAIERELDGPAAESGDEE